MGGMFCKLTSSCRLWSDIVCLCVVMAPVDWQAGSVYIAAFFGLFHYLAMKEDGPPIS